MAIEKTIDITVDNKDAIKGINQINDKLGDIDVNSKDAADGVKGIARSFKGLGTAIKAAGIGLVIGALAKLQEIFMQNQQAANFFNTAFEAVSIAFNDFVNFVINNAGSVIDFFKGIFNDPLQAVKDFGKAIQDNIVERFNSFLDTLGFLASAVKKVFSGDFAGALDDVKSAGKESLDVLTGVNDTFEKGTELVEKTVKAVTNYAKETIKAAAANTELNRQAEIGIAKNRLLLEQYDRQAELQRQIRDDESKTIEERIAANQKLGEVLAEQERLMLANADAQVQAAEAQFEKLKNDENEIALLEARAEKEGVLAQIAGLRSEQLTNINSLERERQDLIDENLEKETEAKQKEIEIANAVKDAKIGIAKNTLKLVSEVAGEGSKIGKGVALAQATISGIEGVQNAYTTAQRSPITALFPAYPIVQAGLAAAFSALQIKKIASTNPSKGTSGGGGGSVGGGGGVTPAAPSFNVIGATGTSQLADAIGGQTQEPVKAYVVSNDVTSAQSLDRNIVEEASI